MALNGLFCADRCAIKETTLSLSLSLSYRQYDFCRAMLCISAAYTRQFPPERVLLSENVKNEFVNLYVCVSLCLMLLCSMKDVYFCVCVIL